MWPSAVVCSIYVECWTNLCLYSFYSQLLYMVASLEKSFGQEGEGESGETVLQLKTLLCGDYKCFNSIFNINIDNYNALATIQCLNINVVNEQWNYQTRWCHKRVSHNFSFFVNYYLLIGPIRLKFSVMILHSPSELLWLFQLHLSISLKETIKRLKIIGISSFSPSSPRWLDRLSWNFYISLLKIMLILPWKF